MAEYPSADRTASALRSRPSLLRRTWPYAAVIVTGALCWVIAWGVHLDALPATASDDTVGLSVVLMLLDLLLGIGAIAVLPLRRRHPLAIALLVSALLGISATATGAAVFAVLHLALVARLGALLSTGAVWILALLGNDALLTSIAGVTPDAAETASLAAVAALIYIALIAIGKYRRARAETLRLLAERAEAAERDRTRELRAARENERMRIAREMHDVLAHRISLVSLHAGALTYRGDLPREKIAEAAHIIQETTTLALSELRGVLGVLRDTDAEDPCEPQPLLEHLPILLAETRAAGVAVEIEFLDIETHDEQPLARGLSEAISRTAYRIVQEGLTNARKHAPGETVRVHLAHVGDQLTVVVRNGLPATSVRNPAPSGMGLVGLAERAQLAGGTLVTNDASGEFVLKGRLPWR